MAVSAESNAAPARFVLSELTEKFVDDRAVEGPGQATPRCKHFANALVRTALGFAAWFSAVTRDSSGPSGLATPELNFGLRISANVRVRRRAALMNRLGPRHCCNRDLAIHRLRVKRPDLDRSRTRWSPRASCGRRSDRQPGTDHRYPASPSSVPGAIL